MSALSVFGYVVLFVISGVPLIGFTVDAFINFGRYVYRTYPFIRKFFDEYFDHYGLGLIITIVTIVVYGLLHWFNFV